MRQVRREREEKKQEYISFLIPGYADQQQQQQQQQHRREISGYVNNHRPVPPVTSMAPPRRASASEVQRLSLNKENPTINDEYVQVKNSRTR